MAQIDVENYLNQAMDIDSLWDQGLGESQQAEELRDRMDAPWWNLTEQEFALVRWTRSMILEAKEDKEGVPLR